MTRVMFWNIQTFSLKKVADPSMARKKGGTGINGAGASGDQLFLMMRLIAQADPDILAIVEVRTGGGQPGTLVTTNGIAGALNLHANMRHLNPAWCLVPPLKTSDYEGVAVFYRSDKLIFSGPFHWPGGAAGRATPAPRAPSGPYPLQLDARIGRRVVPAESRYNPEQREEFSAAQTTNWNAYSIGPGPVFQSRQPYLTTFAELNADDSFKRDIALCSVHGPADTVPNAERYMRQLGETKELVDPLGPNEVRILAGDFNVNLLEEDGGLNQAYADLRKPPGSFSLGLSPVPVPAGGVPPAGQGFYATHMRERRHARFWPPLGDYPGYGYIGSDLIQNFYAIDNMLARGSRPRKFTILNPVVGSPFLDRRPPGYPAPRGTYGVNRRAGLPAPTELEDEIPHPFNLPNPPGAVTPGEKSIFRSWLNFGRVRGTSDHLPIAMEV
jgi:Endonuclease/Exonuclease/phosphatase family